MIELQNISKSFISKKRDSRASKVLAVDDLSLSVKKGEILGLIGPNGAGKTTILKILSTLILPTRGTASIDGFDIIREADKVKDRIGLLTSEYSRSFYWRLSGKQNLEFFAKLRNIKNVDQRIAALIELFKLTSCKDKLVMEYSTGMKHKLALALGLLHDPPVLFLDEPLSGIDLLTSIDIKRLIKTEFKGKTIIWASHNLYEIEEMCDRVVLLNKGKIMLMGTPNELKKECWDHTKIVITTTTPEAFHSLPNVEIGKNHVEIKCYDLRETLIEISKIIKEFNIYVEDIQMVKPSLEEIFKKGISSC